MKKFWFFAILLLTSLIIISGCVNTKKDDTKMLQTWDIVSITYVATLPNGDIFEQTKSGEVLKFTIWSDETIKGLEKEIIGMTQGEEKTIIVMPSEGYGYLYNPRKEQRISSVILDGKNKEIGSTITVWELEWVIQWFEWEWNKEKVIIDFNPLETYNNLKYKVKVVSVDKYVKEVLE